MAKKLSLLSFFVRPHLESTEDSLKPLPLTNEDIVRLGWEKINNKLIIKTLANNPSQISFEIDQSAFSNVTSDNLSRDISNLTYTSFEYFRNALNANNQHTKFSEWWSAIAYKNARLFQFDFSQGPWQIPWEMLLGLLVDEETRTETAFVRCIGQPENASSCFWTDSLRILLIKSEAEDLHLDNDIKLILDVWDGSEKNLQLAVEKPKVIKANKATIIQQLHEYQPHMIWFIGHGYFDGVAHLVFSKNEEMTADEFAELFELAEHHPKFAVFWACELLQGSRNLNAAAPNLFRALSGKGVETMVGMQSVIAENAVKVMATELLHGIVHGFPLEWAMAKARAWLYQFDDEEKVTMNWAAPVVWCAKRPVARLKWNQTELDNLQLQLLGTISIDEAQKGLGLGIEPPDNDARIRAEDWLSHPITVVRGDPNSLEHKLWFLRALKGVQAISKNAVLVIVHGEGEYYRQNLQLWAKSFVESLELGKLPESISIQLDILINDAEIGWRRLCALDNLFLAVIGPPPASEDWFWTPFLRYPEHRAILTKNEIPENKKEAGVSYEKAGNLVEKSIIEAAFQEHNRLLAVLSLINIPIRSEILKQCGIEWKPDELFKNWPDLFVKSFSGFVIRANVRQRILELADIDTIKQSGFDSLKVTETIGHAKKPFLKELRIDLFLDLGFKDAALYELIQLLSLYREMNDEVSMMKAALNRKYSEIREGLSAWEWFNWASLFLEFGEQQMANYCLIRDPENPLDTPFKLSLQAEYSKNEGAIDQARLLIEEAIKDCKENQARGELDEAKKEITDNDYLYYRHDRARLLQFQENRYAEAASEYSEIITITEEKVGLNTIHPLNHLLAVAHRNLGECKFNIEDDPLEDRFREAENHFQTALQIENKMNPFSFLIADIYYQLAKLAERKSSTKEVREQLNKCLYQAEVCRYGLLTAIAKNWLIWLDVQEKSLHWDQIAQRWDLVADALRARSRHSWAARTLLNSILNVAHMLFLENNYELCQAYLQENLSILRGNINLRRRGDSLRIARTLAGLQLIENKLQGNQNFWQLLNSEFSNAGIYVSSLGWSSPQEAW
jgi:tetratricopeptide (TPR) repeat protein